MAEPSQEEMEMFGMSFQDFAKICPSVANALLQFTAEELPGVQLPPLHVAPDEPFAQVVDGEHPVPIEVKPQASSSKSTVRKAPQSKAGKKPRKPRKPRKPCKPFEHVDPAQYHRLKDFTEMMGDTDALKFLKGKGTLSEDTLIENLCHPDGCLGYAIALRMGDTETVKFLTDE
jgi:hypothetical protein